ncbi:hypothetical protein AAZX31_15G193300 [Glycine max]
MEDENGNQNSAPPQNGGFLIPNIFTLTIPKLYYKATSCSIIS